MIEPDPGLFGILVSSEPRLCSGCGSMSWTSIDPDRYCIPNEFPYSQGWGRDVDDATTWGFSRRSPHPRSYHPSADFPPHSPPADASRGSENLDVGEGSEPTITSDFAAFAEKRKEEDVEGLRAQLQGGAITTDLLLKPLNGGW